MVLDILMPELDGTEVCRQVRASSRIPIVFLSSRDDEVDRILGLELGGDDYVTKPFSPRELVARVRAVLRRVPPPPNAGSAPDARSGSDAQPGSDAVAAVAGASGPSGACVRAILTHGRLSLDPDRFVARWGDTEVVLTATEFAVVQALLGYPEKVFRRDELMERAYGADTVVSDRTIDSHVRRVRKKFADAGGAVIETVHGVGYRLGPCR
jgi:two-component system OmpR family response regulator